MTIIVQRSGALGDVILTTPIIRRLRRENPEMPIAVLTAYGDVFRHNPHLNIPIPGDYSADTRLIQLDLAYELHPEMHIVVAYMAEAFGDAGKPHDLQQELFWPPQRIGIEHQMHSYWVAVHAAVAGWSNRTLPRSTWRAIIEGIRKAGLWPVLIGTSRDDVPDCEVTRFFSNDIASNAYFISQCACFVGSDSSLLHVAGATNTPIIGIFTCVRPETRLPWRNGILGHRCTEIVADIECAGCLHRRPPPVTTEACERSDNACVYSIRADQVVDAVVAAASGNFTH